MILQIDNVWPASLPLPRVDYSGSVVTSSIASSVSSGVIARRSRFHPMYAAVTFNWVLTETQYSAFRTFFETDLGNGLAAFEISLRYPQNTELTDWMVRFAGEFNRMRQETGIWVITALVDIIHPKLF